MAVKTGTSQAELLVGTENNDLLIGLGGHDSLTGGEGNDTLDGGAGNDALKGGKGNDTYLYKTANFEDDLIVDGSGKDSIDMSSINSAITTNMNITGSHEVVIGPNSINWSGTTVIENFYGGSAADTITGNSAHNNIKGNEGNDTLNGGLGYDTLDGGAGNDSINGGNSNDKIYVSDGEDTISGGYENDTYIFTSIAEDDTGIGDTILSDVGGYDTLDFSALGDLDLLIYMDTLNSVYLYSNLTFELIDGPSSDLSDIEYVVCGDGNDTVNGNDLDNKLKGNGGDDVLYGYAGEDTLIGGAGADGLAGGDDNDVYMINNLDTEVLEFISDSAGVDTLRFQGYNTTDFVFSAVDNDNDGFIDTLNLYNLTNDYTCYVMGYFNDSSADDDASAAGAGCIENIAFDNDIFNNFSTFQTSFLP